MREEESEPMRRPNKKYKQKSAPPRRLRVSDYILSSWKAAGSSQLHVGVLRLEGSNGVWVCLADPVSDEMAMVFIPPCANTSSRNSRSQLFLEFAIFLFLVKGSHNKEAAINSKLRACDVGGSVTQQKDNWLGNFLGIPTARHRSYRACAIHRVLALDNYTMKES